MGQNNWSRINVDILKELFNEKLARLVLDVDVNNLNPENREEYENLLEVASAEGYMIQ